jgi:hypothetical protein
MKQKRPVSEEEIIELLTRLESEGKIRLNEKEAPIH